MSAQIDWSKAPEGSEYAGTISGGQIQVFYRNVKLNSFEYSYGDNYGWSGPVSGEPSCQPLISRPSTPSWSSEGLPPVGVVCEYMAADDLWIECEVVAHRNNAAIVIDNADDCALVPARELRPIRTHEQIAADEREAAIKQMIEDGDGRGLYVCLEDVLGRLHDKGYRKP